MLINLIGGKKMYKLVLPKEVSGNYWICDESKSLKEKLLNIQAKDGKWLIVANANVNIVNPKNLNIRSSSVTVLDDEIDDIPSISLSENSMYVLQLRS